ncbi:cell surface glycoprotein CD200 receptor 2-like isoform X2 [Rana temporaria]|uniref:cell surface glycoprotein CD200 receptor 2-like isoform X2 n=1 Tax=Rana temporaria TaxID=8407 RepID=UPI001AAD4C54|nr:cell surface glycoprotein CD200 receptor 2-like isoform X2 [Rana temporaria]
MTLEVNEQCTKKSNLLIPDVTVVVGRRGDSSVVQCGDNPGDQITSVIWLIHHMNNSQCLFSYAPYINGRPQIYNNCSTRMTLTNTTLTIHNTQISDGGNYTCDISSPAGTFIKTIMLQVLAQPFVSLDINSAGSPECRAIGGFPAAEISWIPHSDNINTSEIEDLDDTWTVISTYNYDRDYVACFVSHPTFVNVWSQLLLLPGDHRYISHHCIGRIIAFIFFSCLVIGLFLYSRYKSKVERET